MTVSDDGWLILEDAAGSDIAAALLRHGKVRLERAEHEFVLVLEVLRNVDGLIKDLRLALRRGGSPFAGPGIYPAVGTIVDSATVSCANPVASLQVLGAAERTSIRQAARQVLERAGRSIDSRG
jgi:hypothetical protein